MTGNGSDLHDVTKYMSLAIETVKTVIKEMSTPELSLVETTDLMDEAITSIGNLRKRWASARPDAFWHEIAELEPLYVELNRVQAAMREITRHDSLKPSNNVLRNLNKLLAQLEEAAIRLSRAWQRCNPAKSPFNPPRQTPPIAK